MNDDRIIELFWNRDESAVSELSEKYGKYLAAVSRNILENEEYTEDCVNDTLLEVWESIPPNRPARLSAFIGRIARNIALYMLEKFRAKRRGSGERELILDELGEIASAYSVESAYEKKELLTAVNDFLKTLEKRKRIVFVLRYWHGCDVCEIAEVEKISVDNVYNILKRVRKKLIKYLRQHRIMCQRIATLFSNEKYNTIFVYFAFKAH